MIRKSRLVDSVLEDASELEKFMYPEEIEEILDESPQITYENDYKMDPENTSFWVRKRDFEVSMGFKGG